MTMKYWARDSGKSIYHGPEEEMIKHMERDPNCVEVPEDRPTSYHDWRVDEWVENPTVKRQFMEDESERLLRETDRFMVLDSPLTEEQMIEMRAYRSALREVNAGNEDTLPTPPDFI